MDISAIIQGILAPLPPDIFLAALVSGIIFGALYNAKLELPKVTVWHYARVGINFIILLFIFRSLYVFVIGATLNPLGWVGIGILWILYCLFILLGQVLAEKFMDYRESKKAE